MEQVNRWDSIGLPVTGSGGSAVKQSVKQSVSTETISEKAGYISTETI